VPRTLSDRLNRLASKRFFQAKPAGIVLREDNTVLGSRTGQKAARHAAAARLKSATVAPIHFD
jgi:hypothetical protein